jgi:hypothetical protein
VGKTIVGPSQEHVRLEVLPFLDSAELIACTSGPLADCLRARLHSGAHTLKDALAHWLISRHADYFEGAVKRGKILLWIRVAGPDEERLAYQTLLASSSNSVGFHDLALPANP